MTKGTAPYTCSVCPKTRDKDSNRWILLNVAPTGLLCIKKWDDRDAAVDGTEHACGEECAHKLFSRFLATGTLKETAHGE